MPNRQGKMKWIHRCTLPYFTWSTRLATEPLISVHDGFGELRACDFWSSNVTGNVRDAWSIDKDETRKASEVRGDADDAAGSEFALEEHGWCFGRAAGRGA